MQSTLELTPRAIVAELDKYIVGQAAAKRAMDAMMGMRKIDIAAIERARAGRSDA